ncbi:MAG TPA: stalk domain-containing protein [Candidatus Elarobacter sp.]
MALLLAGGAVVDPGVLGGAASAAGIAAAEVPVTLDGTALGRVALSRGSRDSLVDVETLAAAAGWEVARLQGGIRLRGEDRTVVLRIGSRLLHQTDRGDAYLSESPVERNGRLYAAVRDAARLFGASVERDGATLALRRPPSLSGAAEIVEIAAPETPRPRRAARPLGRASATATATHANAGRIVLSLDRTRSASVVSFSGQTRGDYLRTSVDATGIDGLGLPSGTVTVGTKDRNASFGALGDPLGGLVLRGASQSGVELYRGDAHHTYFAGRRIADGRSEIGIANGLPDGGGADVVAALFRDGAYDGTIARRLRVTHKAWGDFSRELDVSDRGIGIGFAARTRGRTFLETNLAYATPNLRLGPDDAPISLDAGRVLSDATTAVGGFVAGAGQPLQPFIGVSTRGRNVVASLSATARSLTAALSYETDGTSAQIYAVPGLQRATGATLGFRLPHASVEGSFTSAGGTRDASLELRTTRPGIGVIAGAGLAGGGSLGPIAGLSIPLGNALAIDATTRPAGDGAGRLHLALAYSVAPRRPRGVPTVRALVRVDAAPAAQPLRLFVDGTPVARFAGAATSIDVTRGPHTFAVEAIGGEAASPDVTTTVEAAGDTVALALWPMRAVSGRVVLERGVVVPAGFTPAAISVVIQPGNLSADVAADGTFVFPKQPVAPDATIAVDAGTLPRTLRAAVAVPLASRDEVVLLLRAGMLLETKAFRSP